MADSPPEAQTELHGVAVPAPAAGLGAQLRRLGRAVVLLVHLKTGVAIAAFLHLAHLLRGEPSAHLAPLSLWWHGRLCRLLRVRLSVRGAPSGEPAFYVSNHISWLDIPVLGSLVPVSFVSKAEVRRWPLVGWLAAAGDTVFLPRGAHQAQAIAGSMVARLDRGLSTLIFPEGTTSDGRRVRPFFPRLFAAAVATGTAVRPVAVRYLKDGAPHPTAPFIDDQALPPHLWRLLKEKEVEVEVSFLPPVTAAETDRRSLAAAARAAVCQVVEGGAPPPSPEA